MKYELRDYQREASDIAVRFFQDESKRHNALIVAATGCHAKGSKILMYDGTMKNVEDIVVGDCLVGDDGTKRTVLSLHRGTDKMYEITPIKGEPFVVNGGHILSLHRTRRNTLYPSGEQGIDEISVEEYLLANKNYKHLHKLRKPCFVDFGNEGKSVNFPYLLGLYLGDGSSAGGGFNITSQRKEIEEYLFSLAPTLGMKVRKAEKKDCKAFAYCFSNIKVSRSRPNPLRVFLDDLGLLEITCGFKFIPLQYKIASREDRLQLLAGLLDTDAYYEKNKNDFEYCTKSNQLADDVVFLCRSLGFYCGKSEKIVNDTVYYRLLITGDLNLIPTKVGIRKGQPRRQKKNHLVTGFSVKYVGRGHYYGFTLDGNHLYCDGQFFIHHNSGKSLIIADIAYRLNAAVLVLCPSVEILTQNYLKMRSYGVDCAMYSASVGQKMLAKVTFATIGSIYKTPDKFKMFQYILVDECHLVNSKEGMYKDFFKKLGKKVLGLTASPYRLETWVDPKCYKTGKFNNAKSYLKMLTDYHRPIFSEILYNIDVDTLLSRGYLSEVNYYYMPPKGWNQQTLFKNTSGTDFTDQSVRKAYYNTNFQFHLIDIIRRLMNPKSGQQRNGILVFTRFVDEARELAENIESCRYVDGSMSKKEREQTLKDFADGKFKVLANAATLIVGYDRPDLDTVVLAAPTMSLARYYQEIGRILRISDKKGTAWCVDLCGNVQRFGEVSDLKLRQDSQGKWNVYSKDRQLTNVYL